MASFWSADPVFSVMPVMPKAKVIAQPLLAPASEGVAVDIFRGGRVLVVCNDIDRVAALSTAAPLAVVEPRGFFRISTPAHS